MSLPGSDVQCLTSRGLVYEESVEANVTCVVFRSWPLPRGYDRATADLLVRLPGGYPDLPPDMWWFDPAVKRADGSMVQNTEAIEHHLGRSWQRWSRHFNAGQWQSGIDGLESFLALIRRELERCAGAPR